MRLIAIAAFACLAATQAEAADWTLLKFPESGFGIESPVALVKGKGAYKAAVAGPLETVTYSGAADGIRYKVTVIDISKRVPEAVNLFEEAEFILSLGGKVVVNEGLGVEPGAQRQYGRELVIDLPDGGRTVTSLMYQKGKLYMAEGATPKGGDFSDYGPQRFADSIVFAIDGPLRDRDSARE